MKLTRPAIVLHGVASVVGLMLAGPSTRATVAQESGRTPTAVLVPAPTLRLTGDVDSNSPAVWDLVEGQNLLHVLTSTAGQPRVASGVRLARLGRAEPVNIDPAPGHGVWMEGVVADEGGTWYGYYHNEIPAAQCGRLDRMMPRIGAARSHDNGESWEDLGIILEAPPGWHYCESPNQYFVGGVGDLSVILDQNSRDLYLFFSQYSRYPSAQGVAVARLPWADRDAPVGRVAVWQDRIWKSPELFLDEEPGRWIYPAGAPLARVTRPWHDADAVNDAFWGAAVHWNTHLKGYVMLLNRAEDERFGQEGIYVAFAPSLDNPALWSSPQRILEGGVWYPQVIGLESIGGTDKLAGARARFFMGGVSDHLIEFSK